MNVFLKSWSEQLPHFLDRWKPTETVVVYCRAASCDASQEIADRLWRSGVDPVYYFQGGWQAWQPCGHIGLHERIERKRIQNIVEFGWAIHVEDADVSPLACDAPEMKPLTLGLQFFRPLVLPSTRLLDVLRINVVRNSDGDSHMK